MKTTLKKLSIPKPSGGFDELYTEDFVTQDGLMAEIEEFRNLIYKLHFEKDEVTEIHPFYIQSLEDENVVYDSTATCRLSIHAADVEYNYGYGWMSLSDVETIVLNKGERVYFRYVGDEYLSGGVEGVFGNDLKLRLTTTTKTFDVGGDVRTIVYGNTTKESISGNGLKCFFYGSNVVNSDKLNMSVFKSVEQEGCYSMFSGCSSLTTAPELPATKLASGCYSYMFKGCSNLNYIKCLATDISATDCTTNWVNGVAETGTFVKEIGVEWETGINGIPEGWTVEEEYDPYVTFTAEESGSSIGLSKLSSNQTLEYKTESSDWTSMSKYTNITLDNIGDKVYVRGVLSGNNTRSNSTQFKMTGKIAASGNCNALWNYSDLNASLKEYCGYYMFGGCTSLTQSPALPSTTLAGYCYNCMFQGCTSLTTAPALPATTLASNCYQYMFSRCTSLTTAPALPATTVEGHCYQYMFENCTSLTTAPELPATILAGNCYDSMFNGCTSLTTTPALPATTLSHHCYSSMFKGCISLTTVPELPATILAGNCYSSMFSGCTSLTTAPELPATTLANYCYLSMFYNCTSLTTAPNLPATTLKLDCYNNMFAGCTSLTTAPDLPATTLASNCYKSMFSGCTSLTTAPELPATTLADNCYRDMFSGCSNLNYIKCLATDISATNCTYNWVSGVSLTGMFDKPEDMNDWEINSVNGIPIGWTFNGDEIIEGENLPYVTFTAEEDNSSVGLAFLSTNQTLEFSTDTTTWKRFDTSTNISLNNGNKVYVRGMLSADNTGSNLTRFKMSGKIAASGNCNAIWNYQDLNAPLKAYCGISMFQNCTSLTKAPELPATKLADYCYNSMFALCTSLTQGPKILPATTLTNWCYSNMFDGCTSLTVAPELPATTLTERCYQSMFLGCTSLTTSPELPATTLAIGCYEGMFSGCTNINHIKCLATDISASICTLNWVYNVASTGTFIKHPDMSSWTTGRSGIPSNWEVVS